MPFESFKPSEEGGKRDAKFEMTKAQKEQARLIREGKVESGVLRKAREIIAEAAIEGRDSLSKEERLRLRDLLEQKGISLQHEDSPGDDEEVLKKAA